MMFCMYYDIDPHVRYTVQVTHELEDRERALQLRPSSEHRELQISQLDGEQGDLSGPTGLRAAMFSTSQRVSPNTIGTSTCL